MNQIALPVAVSPAEIARQRTLGAALQLCVTVADLNDKAVMSDLRVDKAQWSRWESGREGIVWPKLTALMDHCGNDVPVLWMAAQRNYDLTSLRKVESELERENRDLREQLTAAKRLLGVRV